MGAQCSLQSPHKPLPPFTSSQNSNHHKTNTRLILIALPKNNNVTFFFHQSRFLALPFIMLTSQPISALTIALTHTRRINRNSLRMSVFDQALPDTPSGIDPAVLTKINALFGTPPEKMRRPSLSRQNASATKVDRGQELDGGVALLEELEEKATKLDIGSGYGDFYAKDFRLSPSIDEEEVEYLEQSFLLPTQHSKNDEGEYHEQAAPFSLPLPVPSMMPTHPKSSHATSTHPSVDQHQYDLYHYVRRRRRLSRRSCPRYWACYALTSWHSSSTPHLQSWNSPPCTSNRNSLSVSKLKSLNFQSHPLPLYH